MIFRDDNLKKDLSHSWNRSDRAFFAAGACHILAHVFLQEHENAGFAARLILPHPGYRGSHVFVSDGTSAFDYHGMYRESHLLESYFRKIQRQFPGWQGEIIPISQQLVSTEFCERYNHRMPHQFLLDPIPRAKLFINRLLA